MTGTVLGWMALLQAIAIVVITAIINRIVTFEFRKREQAALVAALFAEWISRPLQKRDLNRLAWEATLWLPDELATAVCKRLANDPGAKDFREILVDIKGLIHGKKSKMHWPDIVYYPQEPRPS